MRGTFGRPIVICVSPLAVLMLDQRRKYAPRGLATEFVGGYIIEVRLVIAAECGLSRNAGAAVFEAQRTDPFPAVH